MKKILFALALLSLAVFAAPQTRAVKATRTAIVHTVKAYVAKNSASKGKIAVVKLDVQGSWALAEIEEKGLDNAKLLLHRLPKGWKVLVLGSALYGTGKIYGVPKALRKRWDL